MRTPSRRVVRSHGQAPLPVRIIRDVAAAILVIPLLVLIAPLAAIVALASWPHQRAGFRHQQQLMASRSGESICQFARSFDFRRTDTWVLRAVYEGLQGYVATAPAFPIHADDSLVDDLMIDPEDRDMAVVEIAAAARRSLSDYERNPVYPGIVTVRDLVSFLVHQPLTEGNVPPS